MDHVRPGSSTPDDETLSAVAAIGLTSVSILHKVENYGETVTPAYVMHLPRVGETVELDGARFRVTAVVHRFDPVPPHVLKNSLASRVTIEVEALIEHAG